MAEKDFKLEEAFEKLDTIIDELEKPDISLENSFALISGRYEAIKSLQ